MAVELMMVSRSHQPGFSLVELLIGLMVASMVCLIAYTACSVYQRHYQNQKIIAVTQQNLSAAVVVMEHQIRMAGYDPLESSQFGIVDVRRYDLVVAGRVNAKGQPALFYTLDRNGDGVLEGGAKARNGEHPSFRIRQLSDGSDIYLSYDNGSGRRPLAGNIEAMGFAYAVDVDQDGRLDTWQNGSHVIWSVDSDNDNLLDSHIDTNNDGLITLKDDLNGDGKIDGNDGAVLSAKVELRHIKSVRIWLLAVSSRSVTGHWNAQSYVVGDRIMSPVGDGRLRRMLETTIDCRNL